MTSKGKKFKESLKFSRPLDTKKVLLHHSQFDRELILTHLIITYTEICSVTKKKK